MTYKTKNWKRKNNKRIKKKTLYKTTTCCKLQFGSLLQSTHNTKPDMTIHTDIGKING